jgi:quercetin dioxygenase-like cupin family protein
MQHVNLSSLALADVESELDPNMRLRVAFPHSSSEGNESLATVYFEIEPGDRLAVHQDSAEELLLVLQGEGEAIVGDETGIARAGEIVTVPAMVRHGIRNVGTETLRVLGFFSASTVVSTFEEPIGPGDARVFVIGAPIPIVLPLEEPVAV